MPPNLKFPQSLKGINIRFETESPCRWAQTIPAATPCQEPTGPKEDSWRYLFLNEMMFSIFVPRLLSKVSREFGRKGMKGTFSRGKWFDEKRGKTRV